MPPAASSCGIPRPHRPTPPCAARRRAPRPAPAAPPRPPRASAGRAPPPSRPRPPKSRATREACRCASSAASAARSTRRHVRTICSTCAAVPASATSSSACSVSGVATRVTARTFRVGDGAGRQAGAPAQPLGRRRRSRSSRCARRTRGSDSAARRWPPRCWRPARRCGRRACPRGCGLVPTVRHGSGRPGHGGRNGIRGWRNRRNGRSEAGISRHESIITPIISTACTAPERRSDGRVTFFMPWPGTVRQSVTRAVDGTSLAGVRTRSGRPRRRLSSRKMQAGRKNVARPGDFRPGLSGALHLLWRVVSRDALRVP